MKNQRGVLVVPVALALVACGSDDAGGAGSEAGTGAMSSGGAGGTGATAGSGNSGGSGNAAGSGSGGGSAGGGAAGSAGAAGSGGSAGQGSGGSAGGASCVAKLLLDEGFESGSLPNNLTQSGNLPEVVKGAAREGSYVMRSRLTPQSPVKYRTEVSIDSEGLDLQANTTYWVGFSVKLDADYEGDTSFVDNAMLFQAHYRPWKFTNPPPGAQPMKLQHKHPASFSFHDEVPGVGKLYQAPRGKVGQWVDWVINFRFSESSAGFFKVWRDGAKVVDYKGSNHQGFFDKDGFYLKMGMYTARYKNTPMPSGASRTVYHDALRIAGPDGCYGLVAPK